MPDIETSISCECYWRHLVQNMNTLRHSGQLCDMTILSVENTVFPVHSDLIVSSCRSIGSELVKRLEQADGSNISIMSGLSAAVLGVCLDFIYGKLPEVTTDLDLLLDGTRRLGIDLSYIKSRDRRGSQSDEKRPDLEIVSGVDNENNSFKSLIVSQLLCLEKNIEQTGNRSPEAQSSLVASRSERELSYNNDMDYEITKSRSVSENTGNVDSSDNEKLECNKTTSGEDEARILDRRKQDKSELYIEKNKDNDLLNKSEFLSSVVTDIGDIDKQGNAFDLATGERSHTCSQSPERSQNSQNTSTQSVPSTEITLSDFLPDNQDKPCADEIPTRFTQKNDEFCPLPDKMMHTDQSQESPTVNVSGQSSSEDFSSMYTYYESHQTEQLTSLLQDVGGEGRVQQYKCIHSDCKFTSLRVGVTLRHMRTHHAIEMSKYQCNLCEGSFFTKNSVIRHIKMKHSVESNSIDSAVDREKEEKRNERRKRSLERSRELRQQNLVLYSCDDCDYTANSKQQFAAHMLHKHGQEVVGVPVFKCTKCDYRTTDKRSHREHIARHEGKKRHLCVTCGKSYTYMSSLRDHLQYCENKRSHACAQCSSRFNTRRKLQDHVKTIHIFPGLKQYKCGYCGKMTSSRGNCNQHIRNVHSGDKPYNVVVTDNTDSHRDRADPSVAEHNQHLDDEHAPCRHTQIAHQDNLDKQIYERERKSTGVAMVTDDIATVSANHAFQNEALTLPLSNSGSVFTDTPVTDTPVSYLPGNYLTLGGAPLSAPPLPLNATSLAGQSLIIGGVHGTSATLTLGGGTIGGQTPEIFRRLDTPGGVTVPIQTAGVSDRRESITPGHMNVMREPLPLGGVSTLAEPPVTMTDNCVKFTKVGDQLLAFISSPAISLHN